MVLTTKNSLGANFNELNDALRQFRNEQTTKTFRQPGGNAIVNGRYAEGRYGNLFYDSNGVRRILIGQHPVDGHMGIWQSRDGIDVIDELSS